MLPGNRQADEDQREIPDVTKPPLGEAQVRVTVMIQDNDLAKTKISGDGTEGLIIKNEDFYLDGPVSRRVAILDFDPETGALLAGAPYTPPKKGGVQGKFVVGDPTSEDPEVRRVFLLVNAYGLILRTIRLFEGDDVLGRRVRWAFDGPQLLVVPRAGKAENAYYERESRSLQFFFFDSSEGRPIYTAMSRDIVAHETAHAILDGIAPDLYGSTGPQGLALHEAIADLTAIHMALHSDDLREQVLEANNWNLAKASAFASIAEEFGRGRGQEGSLRDLSHDKKMSDVPSREPHDLSEVLSGAMWSLMCRMFDAEAAKAPAGEEPEVKRRRAGQSLGMLAEQFRRVTLRPLDLLPPGEVSFADFGRAVIASDQMSNPDPEQGEIREWLRDEFLAREIVEDRSELDVDEPFDHPAVTAANLDLLETSDFEVYRFVEANRDLFSVDGDAPFTVRPRLRTRIELHRGDEVKEYTDDLLIKVSWDREEENIHARNLPVRRRYTVGTTLVINRKTRQVGAVLTSPDVDGLKGERDKLLAGLCDDGSLRVGPAGQAPFAVGVEVDGDLMRLQGTAGALHVVDRG
jgi:hypothetical protein